MYQGCCCKPMESIPNGTQQASATPRSFFSRNKRLLWIIVVVSTVLVIIGIVVPITVLLTKTNNETVINITTTRTTTTTTLMTKTTLSITTTHNIEMTTSEFSTDQCTRKYSIIQNYFKPFFFFSLQSGDMNHDNRPDIIVAYGSNDETDSYHNYIVVNILFNNDDGRFYAKNVIQFDTTMHCQMNVGDVNGDGDLDIIVTVPYGSVSEIKIFLSNGHGNFTEQKTVFKNCWVTMMKVVDLNADNKSDIIFAIFESKSIITMVATDNDTFTEQMEYNTTCGYFLVEAVDLNNDGTADIVIICTTEVKTTFLFNNGDETYTPEVWNILEREPWNFAVGDINNDEKLDLVFLYNDPSNLSIHLNIGNGNFHEPTFYTNDRIENAIIVLGDFNNDQKVDILAGFSNLVGILFQTDNGRFSDGHFYTVKFYPLAMTINDIDNNNQLDIIVSIEYGIGMFLTYCN